VTASNQTIALTGLWQALDLVHQLARNGELDTPQRKRFDSCIDSLFIRVDSAGSTAQIFGGRHRLEYAFHGFAFQLEQVGKRHQVLVYMLHLLALQKRVAANAELAHRIAERLGELERQRDFFIDDDSRLIANLADLYLNTLGSLPMNQRIRIYGKGEFLQSERVQHGIRALLLAALRAAMLWREMGGNRLLLLFQRKRMLRELSKVL